MSRARRHSLAWPLLAAVALLIAAPSGVSADGWHGQGHASGTVRDADGKPLPAAKVTLRRSGEASGPLAATTDARGRWSMLGLAEGRWELTIAADDFITATGSLEVTAAGPGVPLEVWLRPRSEQTPPAAENAAVVAWIEKGNTLLTQGHPAQARAEYEKALGVLPADQRAEVLQAVARTWFLQGDRERAVQTVEEGLRLAPANPMLRQLLHLLLEDLGRAAEADSFLAALPSVHPPPAPADADPSSVDPELAALLAAPAAPAAPGRRGGYKVSFTERAPAGTLEELLRRGGYRRDEVLGPDPHAFSYALAEESFEALVPEGEGPASGWGLVVWISPGPFGGALRPETRAALSARRLIWVGADRAGNDRSRWDRLALALDAAWNMQRLYPIDPSRVYVAGYSGGGRMASALALLYPDVFRGGLMMMGIDWYADLPVPDRPGNHWPAIFHRSPRELLKLARERSRFVLLTAEQDFNRPQTRAIDAALRHDRFANVTLLEVPGIGHAGPVPGTWLERALAALDGTAPAGSSGPGG